MLRHQIIILRRRSPHPKITRLDRIGLLLAAAVLPTWRRALAIVQPETLLRWHRDGFRSFWRRRSRGASHNARLEDETIKLIRDMVARNPLWGAERIRGELLKVGIRVSKRTVQKYMWRLHRPDKGQKWSTFVRNHAHDIWCCGFVQAYDLLIRPVFLFFHREPMVARNGAHGSHAQPDAGVDCAATSQRDDGRSSAEVSSPRPGREVWKHVRSRGKGCGDEGDKDAQCVRRT